MLKLGNNYLQSNGYKPSPLDLSGITLSEKLEELVELLAENNHNVWAETASKMAGHMACMRWPEKISNTDLWQRTNQEPASQDIRKRKWGWIGHTLRKPADNLTRRALGWNPQGRRRVGRPRDVEEISPQRGRGSWHDMVQTRMGCPEPDPLAGCGCGPMLHWERIGTREREIFKPACTSGSNSIQYTSAVLTLCPTIKWMNTSKLQTGTPPRRL